VVFIDTGAAWSGKALAGRGWLENSNKEDAAFDFTNGDGSPENPYQITNVSELLLLSHAVSGDIINPGGAKYADLHYRLLADMDMSGVDWFPIGYYRTDEDNKPFSGVFDGGGFKITNLNIESGKFSGLFGILAGEVRNLTVAGKIEGRDFLGAIASSNAGTISNCRSEVTIRGGGHIGGIVGINAGDVINCSFTGDIRGSGDNIGGIAGYNYRGNLRYCSFKGAVSCAGFYAGGVTAYNDAGEVRYSAASGTVKGAGNYVGGLVGYNASEGVVTDCASSSAVSGTGYYVGGLAAYNSSGGIVRNSVFSGNAGGTGYYVGGIVAFNAAGAAVEYCVSSASIAGTGDYIGGLAGFVGDGGDVRRCVANAEVRGFGDHFGEIAAIVEKGILLDCLSVNGTGPPAANAGDSQKYIAQISGGALKENPDDSWGQYWTSEAAEDEWVFKAPGHDYPIPRTLFEFLSNSGPKSR
jgi:hypothetical protein